MTNRIKPRDARFRGFMMRFFGMKCSEWQFRPHHRGEPDIGVRVVELVAYAVCHGVEHLYQDDHVDDDENYRKHHQRHGYDDARDAHAASRAVHLFGVVQPDTAQYETHDGDEKGKDEPRYRHVVVGGRRHGLLIGDRSARPAIRADVRAVADLLSAICTSHDITSPSTA